MDSSTPPAATPARLVCLLAVLPLTACDVALLGTGRGLHDLRGRYDGRFAVEWDSFRGGTDGFEEGPGVIVIRRHFGSGFSGEWSWRLDRHLLRGDLDRGREEFRGDVSFSLEVGFRGDLLEELTGCFFVSGDRHFHGHLDRGRLRAERVGRVRCRHPFTGLREEVRVRVTFFGRR